MGSERDHVFHLVFHGIPCRIVSSDEAFALRLQDLYRHALVQGPDLGAVNQGTETVDLGRGGALTVFIQPSSKLPVKPAQPVLQLIADEIIWGHVEDEKLILSDGRSAVHVDYEKGEARLELSRDDYAARYVATHRLFPIALSELLRARGIYYLHASCVAHGENGAIVALGDSEAGKSTLAYTALRDGLLYLCDDGLLFSIDAEERAWVEPFYRELSIDPVNLSPSDLARSRPNEPLHTGDQRHHFVPEPSRCVGRAFVAALLLLERTTENSSLESATRGQAYEELLRQNPFVALSSRQAPAHLAALRRLVQSAPSYTLHSGPDLLHQAGRAREVLLPCYAEAP